MGTVESHHSNVICEPESSETKDDLTFATRSTKSNSDNSSNSCGSFCSDHSTFASRPQNSVGNMPKMQAELQDNFTEQSNNSYAKKPHNDTNFRAATPRPDSHEYYANNKIYDSKVQLSKKTKKPLNLGRTQDTTASTIGFFEANSSHFRNPNFSPSCTLRHPDLKNMSTPRTIPTFKQNQREHMTSPENCDGVKPINSLLESHSNNFVAIGSDLRTIDEVNDAIQKITDEESLPAPWYEIERKVVDYLRKSDQISTPLDFQSKLNVAVEEKGHIATSCDTAYLEKLYKHRTWNMYKLICEARQENYPNLYFAKCPKSDCRSNSLNASDTLSHEMIFDME